MELFIDRAVHAAAIGGAATAVMDLWMLARRRLLGLALPDYGLVGRWLAHMGGGRFVHSRIADACPVPGERMLGWAAHYATGIAFAALLLAIGGVDWAREPTPGLAIGVGVATVAAPFLLMQPGMGAGIAASRTPKPWATRGQSVLTHAIFGVGLYAGASLIALVAR